MNVLTEYHKNSADFFGFWGENNNMDLGISSICFEAEKVFLEDEEALISQQKNFLKEILNIDDCFKEYRLYILIYYGVSNPVSSIEKYKKVWKRLDKRFDFGGLIKGKESELQVLHGTIFCSIAQFTIDEMDVVLKIMNEMSTMCTVVASRSDLMTQKEITGLFNISLLSEDNENLPPEIYKIDYKQLCPYLCSKNDIVIRLGNACEEVSLALFFNKEFFKCFHKKVSFDKMTD